MDEPARSPIRPARWLFALAVAAAVVVAAASWWRRTDDIRVVRGPYLQRGTPSSIVVRWRTNHPTPSRVALGAGAGDRTRVVEHPVWTTEHAVVVRGLAPATTYHYAIGTHDGWLAGDDERHVIVTPPPPGPPAATRIWVLGDSGTADHRPAAVRDAFRAFTGERRPDVWLMLGDNAYGSGTDAEYQAAVFDMYPTLLAGTSLWPALGNHDSLSADSPTESGPFFDIFTLPRRGEAGGVASGTEAYYAFDHAHVHFICLDSYGSDRGPGGAMMTWLAEDLAETTAEWIIAYWHHPPYSRGSHDSDVEGELIEMREHALPILEAGGVDLVLTGHSHSYERSFLVDGHYGRSTALEPSMILDGGDGRPEADRAYRKRPGAPRAGAVYAVAGSSGQTSGGRLDHPVMCVSLNELGSLVIDVEGPRLELSFLQADGTVGDRFAIRKDGGATGAPGAPVE